MFLTDKPPCEQNRSRLRAGADSDEVKQRFASEGAQTVQMSTAEFGGFIEKETKKWERVVKEGGIKAE